MFADKNWHLFRMNRPQAEKRFIKKPLLQALAGQVTPEIPFWLMRQAGRYLPEYRELRGKAGSFLNLCFNPELATEVTLQPVRRFGMDAAILFSDILVVPYALGQTLSFVEGEGPQLGNYHQEKKRFVDGFDFSDFNKKLSPVYETVSAVKKGLEGDKGLIGFAGGPWTVACYMVQGRGGEQDFPAAKKFAFENPDEFDRLIDILTTATARHLKEQIRAGADAVQIFESWAGLIPEPYFERWVIAPTRKIVETLHEDFPGFPVIGFPRKAGPLYRAYAKKTGASCIGLDQDYPLRQAAQDFGGKICLQGNLDPATLLAGGKKMEAATLQILAEAKNVPFIFNLGHGIIKETPPEHVADLARIIKAHTR